MSKIKFGGYNVAQKILHSRWEQDGSIHIFLPTVTRIHLENRPHTDILYTYSYRNSNLHSNL